MPQEPQKAKLQIQVPPDQHGGAYADRALVWHTQNGFTIDFLADIGPARPGEDGAPIVTSTVVSRVRIPVSVIFQVARAIGENVGKYEDQYGKIPAGGPDHPPEEQA